MFLLNALRRQNVCSWSNVKQSYVRTTGTGWTHSVWSQTSHLQSHTLKLFSTETMEVSVRNSFFDRTKVSAHELNWNQSNRQKDDGTPEAVRPREMNKPRDAGVSLDFITNPNQDLWVSLFHDTGSTLFLTWLKLYLHC